MSEALAAAAAWLGPLLTLVGVGAAWGALHRDVKRVARDVQQLVRRDDSIERRLDHLEQEFADLRGRVLERMRMEATPPRGVRVIKPPREDDR